MLIHPGPVPTETKGHMDHSKSLLPKDIAQAAMFILTPQSVPMEMNLNTAQYAH